MSLKDKMIGQLGFGTAPLGNMFRAIDEDEAAATVEAAWDHGIRFFDTAPLYGAGLSETRLGKALAQHHRDEYTLATKIGRLISDELNDAKHTGAFGQGNLNKLLSDYSADATLRSIESSLERLGTDRLDIVFVHDVAQDTHGDEWIEHFNVARKGAFKALARLKEEGVIKAWGLGVNRVEPCELTLDLDEVRPDGFLLAGRYTLLDHEQPLQRLFAKAKAKGAEFITGGPYSSGVLVGGKHFEYQPATAAMLDKVKRIHEIARRFNVDIKAAALQFPLANPAVTAVIPGASRPSRISEDTQAFKAVIPQAFWQAMRDAGFISPNAPTPTAE
ncbi:aldo/keto reductase [Pseudomonas sp. 7P_10.2_Bac1]|uniref:aldo/keto reductase n=1 Tax=Pseudomonas sp. 7P_10.2_Bac1 TaxID=2971614 RepID=UPI0021C76676|nr:aldo/keto reductase [Pseudomonas sp. 7P_10.2_Bac1]MCU1729489.1 aldo/keto reductase [Pseudomonas sp. 7P_10.2_Bac1]